MSDLWIEKYKLTHRLKGLAQGTGEEIAEILEGALEKVSGKIVSLWSKALETKSLARRKKYLEAQRAEIEKVLNGVYKEIGKKIETKTIETAQAAPAIIDKILKDTIGIELAVPRLSKSRVESWFKSAQIEGLYFNDWLQKLEENAVSRILRETREAQILNESLKRTAKRIQQTLDVSRRSSEGLAHNAYFQAHNWAEYEFYQENQIKKLRFVAELDRRTTPLCISLDQRVFTIEDVPLPPLHWMCRSHVQPVIEGVEIEGKRIARKDTEPRTVKHRDGTTSTKYEKLDVDRVPSRMTHSQWVQSLVNSKKTADVSFAHEMLGPARFNLVKSGKLKVESLYYAGSLRTIKELKALYK